MIFFFFSVATAKKVWIMVFKNIASPAMAQVDFIKDLMQVALLTVAVGGPSFVIMVVILEAAVKIGFS